MDAVKNFGKVTVSTGYASGVTSVVLETGHGAKLPTPSVDGEFNLVWWNWTDYADPSDDPNVEIVRCTARSTDTLTITRAQEGTSDSNHNTGGVTYKMILGLTKTVVDQLKLASTIINTPAGNIIATDVQAAINELDTEKLSTISGISAGGDLSGTYPNPTVSKINGVAYNGDPLTQYALLAGRVGGQALIGGTALGNNLSLQSNSSNDGLVIASNLGVEKLTNGTFTGSASSWSLGTGWTYGGNTVTHAGGAGDLTQTSANMVTPLQNKQYLLQIVLSGGTDYSGFLTITCGGVTVAQFYPDKGGVTNASFSFKFTAINTNSLVFSVDANFDFTVDNVSLKEYTPETFFAGKIGIETTNPQAPLHIVSRDTTTANTTLLLDSPDSQYVGIGFRGGGANGGLKSGFYYDSGNDRFVWGAGFSVLVDANIFWGTGSSGGGITRTASEILKLTGRYGVELIGSNAYVAIPVDSVPFKMGDGHDTAEYYNGADLIIDPKVVGTGRIITGGDLQLGDTSVLGSELVTNGVTFSSGWTAPAGWDVSANIANHSSAGTGALSQSITGLTVGDVYLLTYDYVLSSGTSLTVTWAGFSKVHTPGNQSVRALIKATATSHTISFTPSSNFRGTIDNVSIQKIGAGDLDVGDTTIRGDQIFVGSGNGLPYGSMYGDNISQTVTISAVDTYYEVAGGLTGGQENLCTFQNSKEIKITKAGKYKVDYSMGVYTASANQEIESEVMINGAAQSNTSNHTESMTANRPSSIDGTGILDLAANDVVSLSVSNHTATNNIIVQHANMTLVMIGG